MCAKEMARKLSSRFDDAVVEHRLASGRVPDVVLLRDGEPRFGIEIFVTHAVDDEKAGALTIAWIELGGQAVLDAPLRWIPLRTHKAFTCARCVRLGALLRESGYDAEAHFAYNAVGSKPCRRCGGDVPVFRLRAGQVEFSGEAYPTPPFARLHFEVRRGRTSLMGYVAPRTRIAIESTCHRCGLGRPEWVRADR